MTDKLDNGLSIVCKVCVDSKKNKKCGGQLRYWKPSLCLRKEEFDAEGFYFIKKLTDRAVKP